jgi:hypothetical protein
MGVLLEPSSQGQGILCMTLGTQAQRLDTLNELEGSEWVESASS